MQPIQRQKTDKNIVFFTIRVPFPYFARSKNWKQVYVLYGVNKSRKAIGKFHAESYADFTEAAGRK
jgi:hypothetical protein